MTSRVIVAFGKEYGFGSSVSYEDNRAYRGQGGNDRANTRDPAIILQRFWLPTRMWLFA
jgi:hypothetical protein